MMFFRSVILTGLIVILVGWPLVSFGQFDDGLSTVVEGTNGGYNVQSNLPGTIGLLIQAGLGILGVIFLVLTLRAGFLWMTAQGEESQVKKAKEILVRAVIGMIIVLAAYSITEFIVQRIGYSVGGYVN